MTDFGKRVLAERWPGQELDVLTQAYEAGVTVPYPVEFTGDGMLMQLHHDVTTMCTWFARQGIDSDPEEVFASLLAEAW